MTDDAKEWVTVKVEKPVRDAARDDPRTYTEIMRDGLELAGGKPTGDVSGDPIGTSEFNELFERLSRIESAASTAEERTGSIENTLEGLSR